MSRRRDTTLGYALLAPSLFGVLVFLLTSVSFGVYFSSATLRRVGAINEALAGYAGAWRTPACTRWR